MACNHCVGIHSPARDPYLREAASDTLGRTRIRFRFPIPVFPVVDNICKPSQICRGSTSGPARIFSRRDMIDIQSFLWVLRSEEYEEVRAGRPLKEKMVRPERFELPTLWFVARCSIQLS
jgi:hypothetical protein